MSDAASKEARIAPTGIVGLDLVLGGGLRLLKRIADADESASVLIRGPAGSGKTVLATHLAAAMARTLRGDIAYACIELLPRELQAQLANFDATRSFTPVRVAPFEAQAPYRDDPMLFSVMLDLAQGEDPIGASLLAFLDALDDSGRRVRVLVIDSLSDDHGLGAGVSRAVADGVAKLAAERGLVTILVEERAIDRLSPWCFAVDTVLELDGTATESSRFDRTLTVRKHRFGATDGGPHGVEITAEGFSVLPRVDAWMRPLNAVLPSPKEQQPWRMPNVQALVSRVPDRVLGFVLVEAQGLAWLAVRDLLGDATETRRRIVLDFTVPVPRQRMGTQVILGAANPRLAPEALMLSIAREVHEGQGAVESVEIRDPAPLAAHATPDAVLRALQMMVFLLRRVGIKIVAHTSVMNGPHFAYFRAHADAQVFAREPNTGTAPNVELRLLKGAGNYAWRAGLS